MRYLALRSGNVGLKLRVGITHRRNLVRYLDTLVERQVSLLQRTRLVVIHILNHVAEIAVLVDQGDQAVLDRQMNFCALLHLLIQLAFGLDLKRLATE